MLTRSTPEGRARLPGAEPRQPRQLLRAAAVAAALQADPHGRRARPLLPDRALLPRRGSARRPPAGVHADRHRDVVRAAATTSTTLIEGHAGRGVCALQGIEVPRPFPRLTYAEAMRRFGSDKPDMRFGLELAEVTDIVRTRRVRASSARRPSSGGIVKALRRARRRSPVAQGPRRAARARRARTAPRASPGCALDRRRLAVADRQVPHRRAARGDRAGATGAEPGGVMLCSSPTAPRW